MTDPELVPDPSAPRQLPFVGTAKEEHQLAAANAHTWRLLEHRRRNQEQPSGSRGYQ